MNIKYKLLLILIFIISFPKIYSQNDTMLCVKFNNLKSLFDTTQYSAPDYTANDTLNNILKRFNTSFFAPSYSNYVKNLELKKYYSIRFDGSIGNFIASLDSLDVLDEIDTICLSFSHCSSPISINDERIVLGWSNNDALELIDAQCAWSITQGDTNLRVAFADTDFEPTHEDLVGQIREIYGEISAGNPHGMHMIGAAGAKPNGIGVIGAGYNLRWDGSRVFHKQSTGQTGGNPGPAITNAANKGARVINVSFSTTGDYDFKPDAVQDLINQGIVLVVSAGNLPSSTSHNSIANIPGVILVSGVNNVGEHGPTNYAHNSYVDLCAPAMNVSTLDISNGYTGSWGTSPAAALVSATAGLILSLNPCFTPPQVEQIIKTTTKPILDASSFPGTVGTGYLDMYSALNLAAGRSGTLSSNETWQTIKVINGVLVVPNGITLTIKSTVVFYSNSSIYIQAGGKVIVDGGVLTGHCGWDGIRVEGNSSLNQIGNNQGILELKNEAKIENAINAVSLSGLDGSGNINYSKFGGIIRSDNATFLNNKRDVEFLSYHPKVGSTETNNKSYFINTSFLTTNGFLYYNSVEPHVTMWDVNGIRFLGCKFEDMLTNINIGSGTSGRIGIFSIGSNYLVSDFCLSVPCTPIPSLFINLDNAIVSYGQGTRGNTSISNTTFSCNKGVYLQGFVFPVIRTNTFNISHVVLSSGSTNYPYGLYLDLCHDFNTENNTFNGLNQSSAKGAGGLIIRSSGVNNNVFYRCNFSDIRVATQALGENRDAGLTKGLRFRCNFYSNNYADLDIRDDGVSNINGQIGMAQYQGVVQGAFPKCLDNKFSNYSVLPSLEIGNYAYWTSPFTGMKFTNRIEYVFSGSAIVANRFYPNSISNNVSRVNYNTSENCPNLIESWGNNPWNIAYGLNVKLPLIINKSNELQGHVDGGNTQNLIDIINSVTSITYPILEANLLSYSPYLSNTVLALIAEKESVFDSSATLNLLLANPHSSRSAWVQTNLDNRLTQLPSSYRDSINNLIDSFTNMDSLSSDVASLLDDYDFLLSELVYSFTKDTITQIDSLDEWLKHPVELKYHYALAEMYFNNGDWEMFNDIIDSIPEKFDLDAGQNLYHDAYTTLYEKLHEWQSSDSGIYFPDSTRFSWILDFGNEYSSFLPVKYYSLLAINDSFPRFPDVYIDEIEGSTLPNTGQETSVNAMDYNHLGYSIWVFPNPVSNGLTLSWKGSFVPSTIRIYDLSGKLCILNSWENSDDIRIETDKLSNGIYLLEVIDRNNTKFVWKIQVR